MVALNCHSLMVSLGSSFWALFSNAPMRFRPSPKAVGHSSEAVRFVANKVVSEKEKVGKKHAIKTSEPNAVAVFAWEKKDDSKNMRAVEATPNNQNKRKM